MNGDVVSVHHFHCFQTFFRPIQCLIIIIIKHQCRFVIIFVFGSGVDLGTLNPWEVIFKIRDYAGLFFKIESFYSREEL